MAASDIVKRDFVATLVEKAGLKGLLAIGAAGLLILSKLLKAWRLRGTPPGSMGIPMLGETFEFIKDPWKFQRDRVKKYGPIFTTHVMFSPCVYLSGPLVKELFKSQAIAWPRTWNELLGENSLVTITGPFHRKVRSIASKAFTTEALISYLPRLQELTTKHLERWADKSAKSPERYDPEADIKKYTFEVAEKILLGRSTGETEEGLQTTFNLWLDSYQGLLPWNLPWTAHGKGMKAREELLKQYEMIIAEKRKTLTAEQETDMLAICMNCKDEHGEGMSEAALKDFCIVMMFAGHDTTKGSLNTMLHYLAAHREVEQELIQEVSGLWDGSSPITWDMIEALEAGKCGRFIAETMRILPGISVTYRLVTEDMEIGGYRIPKGWKLMTSPPAEHVALAGNKQTVDLSIDHSKWKESEYFPFGGGGRKCVGYRFAREEMLVWLMMLLKNYWLECDPKESKLDVKGFVMQKVKIRVHRRN